MQKFIQSDFKMIIIENKIQEIANTLASYQPVKYGFEGCRGVALFLLQYYQYTKNEIYYNKAIDLIEKEFEFYGEHCDNPSFWTDVAESGCFLKKLSAVREILCELMRNSPVFRKFAKIFSRWKQNFLMTRNTLITRWITT